MSERPSCSYCGDLGWTVEQYGRVTHKEACPHRREAWHQGDPRTAEWVAALQQQVDSDESFSKLVEEL